jgi:thiol:disulfide interchange protein
MATPPPPPPQQAGYPQPQQQGTPGMATAGMVCSLIGMIFSIFPCLLIGIPLGVIGLILSIIGRRHSVERGSGTGLATAGIVMGVLAVVAAAIWIIVSLTADDQGVYFDFDTSFVFAPFLLARAKALIPPRS